jgi:hypothetical protein
MFKISDDTATSFAVNFRSCNDKTGCPFLSVSHLPRKTGVTGDVVCLTKKIPHLFTFFTVFFSGMPVKSLEHMATAFAGYT